MSPQKVIQLEVKILWFTNESSAVGTCSLHFGMTQSPGVQSNHMGKVNEFSFEVCMISFAGQGSNPPPPQSNADKSDDMVVHERVLDMFYDGSYD